jgi:hypothetical protein
MYRFPDDLRDPAWRGVVAGALLVAGTRNQGRLPYEPQSHHENL